MTNCPHCGRPSQPNARFCRGCGQRLAEQPVAPAPQPPCETCGAEPVPHALFCHRCGHPLASEAPTTMINASPPPPATRTPAEAQPIAAPRTAAAAPERGGVPSTSAPQLANDEMATPFVPALENAHARPSGALPNPEPAGAIPPRQEATTIVPHRDDRTEAPHEQRSPTPEPRSPTPPTSMTRLCSGCGTAVARNARFCRSCGAALNTAVQHASPQASVCSGCGKEIESWAHFCRHCGASHPVSAAQGGAADQWAAACIVCGAQAAIPGGMCTGCAETLS